MCVTQINFDGEMFVKNFFLFFLRKKLSIQKSIINLQLKTRKQ